MNEALQQIAYADRLVLNKTDLATPEELDDLEARLRDINSLAQVRIKDSLAGCAVLPPRGRVDGRALSVHPLSTAVS